MKKLNLSFLIILAAVLILQAVVSAVFIADFTARERAQFNVVAAAKIGAAIKEAERAIEQDIAAAESLALENVDENTDVPKGYHAVAFMSEGGIAVKTPDSFNNYSLKEYGADKLDGGKVKILSEDDVYEGGGGNTYAFYCKQSSQGILMLLKKAEELINPSFLYDFKNILIITEDGKIITDYANVLRQKTIGEITQAEDILNKNADTIYTFVSGERVLLSFAGIETEYGSFKAAGYIPSAAVDEHIQKGVLRLCVIVALFYVMTLAFSIVYIKAYIRKYNKLTCIKNKQSIYVLYIDKFGKIIRANAKFKKEFDTYEIFDKICEIGISALKIIENNLPMTVLLNDREDKERFITFLNSGTINGCKLIGEEVTPLMQKYYETLKLLSKDENLDIYNKRQFALDYEKAHEELRGSDGAYVLFELKNTKNYRVMFGEGFYEEIKKKFADVLTEKFKGYGRIYFLDNEKFALLVLGNGKAKQFQAEIAAYMKEINLPAAIGDNLIKIECLAGIVIIDKNMRYKTADEIYSYAALSVDKAQELKRLYSVYETAKSGYVMSQSRKREIVRYIMENNQVEVHFQPQFSLIKNKIVGFEALCRLSGRYEKDIKIQEFIEVAEQSGYMIALGEFIYEKAFRFAKEAEAFNVTVSLNVSPVQLMQTGFVKNFLDKFNTHLLKPGSICLEITETFLMTSFEEVVEKLEILSANGINIHLDDFGVAYSSMLYLKKLPINTIKIDKEFIADITNNNFSRVICSKIIDITKELGLDSIAEGVETRQQLDCLKELDCKIIQGFLIGNALPPERAKSMLADYNIRGIRNV